jgi:hypothetical protein
MSSSDNTSVRYYLPCCAHSLASFASIPPCRHIGRKERGGKQEQLNGMMRAIDRPGLLNTPRSAESGDTPETPKSRFTTE